MITTADVRDAADVFRPVFDATDGQDGRVSIEVDPRLAHDTRATIAEAKQLAWLVDRPNTLIKIPATEAGLPAIADVIGRGHQRQRHADLLAGALPRGDGRLPDRSGEGQGRRPRPLARSTRSRPSSCPGWTPRSTSGWRRSAPTRPRRSRARPPSPTRGWPTRRTRRSSPPTAGQALEKAGANKQRPLWASTGVKDPAYPDTLYVDRAGRAEHGEHHAGGDPGRHRRPRRDHRRHDPRHLRAGRGPSWTPSRRSASRTTRSSSCWRTRASRSSRRPGTSCWTPPRRNSNGSLLRRPEVSTETPDAGAATRCGTRWTAGCPRIAGPSGPGHLRRDGRPVPQEADAGRLRPGQPRPAAAGLRPGRLRPPRAGRTRTSRRRCTTPSRSTPAPPSARRCGSSSPRAAASCRATSTTTPRSRR